MGSWAEANTALPMMFLEDLHCYDLESLGSKKRNQVRKGLSRVEVRPVEEHDAGWFIEEGLEVNLSALARQGWSGDRSHYTDRRRWEGSVASVLGRPGYFTYGAFKGRRLVAYLRAMAVVDSVYITSAMSHTDHLQEAPNDALIYSFCSWCRTLPGVRRVIFGLFAAKPSLNRYKEQLGFRRRDLPTYRWINPAVRWAVRLTRYRHYQDIGRDIGRGEPQPRG